MSPPLLRDLLLRTSSLLASLAISGPTPLTATASSSVTPDTSRCARHVVLVLRTAGKLGFVFMKRLCRLAITAAPQVSEALPRALLEVTAASPDLTDTMGKVHREVRVLPAPRDTMDRDLQEAMGDPLVVRDPRLVDLPLVDLLLDLPLDLPDCKERDD